MKKEDGIILIQLVGALKESVSKLENAYNKKDEKNLENVKKEILNLQKKIGSIVD